MMPVRKRPTKTEPTPPDEDVRDLQDPEQTEADFLRDLERAATNRAAEKLEHTQDT
jgi:DNA-binding protein YbaB